MATVIKIGDRGYQLLEQEAEQLEEILGWGPTELRNGFALLAKGKAGVTHAGPMIYPAMIAAMRAVTAVGKDGYNTAQNYPFRGIDGVLNALGPALREAGVFPVPTLESVQLRDARTTRDQPTREVQVQVRYTFYAEDGSSVEAVVPGESLDTGDKGTAKAMSVAFRIALLQIFALPTQEPTTDHDGHHHTRGGEPRMTKFERETGAALLGGPTAEQRQAGGALLMRAAFQQALAFGACLDEHAAWLTPTNGDESPTWEETFAARIAAEIEACDTGDAVNEVWAMLKAADRLGFTHEDGKRTMQLLKERAAAIKERNANALDTVTAQVLSASLDDLEGADSPVLGSIENARDLERITDEHAAGLLALMAERIKKLTADLPDASLSNDEAPAVTS